MALQFTIASIPTESPYILLVFKACIKIKQNYEDELQDINFKWRNYVIQLSITLLVEGVLSSYPMKVSSHYVQVLCLPSANHVPCTHRSRHTAIVFRVFLTLMFDSGLYSTVPHIQDCCSVRLESGNFM